MPKKKFVEGELQETIKGLAPDEGAEQKTVSALSPKTPAEERQAGNGGEVLPEGRGSSPPGESNSFSEELKSADKETSLDQTAPLIPITEDVIPDIPEVATANLEEGPSMEMEYFSKLGVAEFTVEADTFKVGDKMLITGPTTGVIYVTADEIHDDYGPVEVAQQGTKVSIAVPAKVRPSDKLFKLEQT